MHVLHRNTVLRYPNLLCQMNEGKKEMEIEKAAAERKKNIYDFA